MTTQEDRRPAFTGEASVATCRDGSHIYVRFAGRTHTELKRRSIGWLEASDVLKRRVGGDVLIAMAGIFDPNRGYKVQQKRMARHSYVEMPLVFFDAAARLATKGAVKARVDVYAGGVVVVHIPERWK